MSAKVRVNHPYRCAARKQLPLKLAAAEGYLTKAHAARKQLKVLKLSHGTRQGDAHKARAARKAS